MRFSNDVLGGEVDLDVISVTGKLESMAAEDLSKW